MTIAAPSAPQPAPASQDPAPPPAQPESNGESFSSALQQSMPPQQPAPQPKGSTKKSSAEEKPAQKLKEETASDPARTFPTLMVPPAIPFQVEESDLAPVSAQLAAATEEIPEKLQIASSSMPTVTPSDAPAGKAAELGFAARLLSQESQAQPSSPQPAPKHAPEVAGQPQQAAQTTPVKTEKTEEASPAAKVSAAYRSTLSEIPVLSQSTPARGESAGRIQEPAKLDSATARLQVASEPAAEPSAPSGPLRQITMHVADPAQGRAEVRILDRGGEVSVAVRTPDPQLASSLRQNLDDLASRLERQGFQTELWRPTTEPASAQADLNRQGQGQQPDAEAGRDKPPGRRNQDREKKQTGTRPSWVRELEATTGVTS